MKKEKPIKSYSVEQLRRRSGQSKKVIVLVEADDDTYRQVSLTNEEFTKVCSILNKSPIGFLLDLYDAKMRIEFVDEEE